MIIVLLGIIIYPNIYRYDVVKSTYEENLIKTNRYTGKIYILNSKTLEWQDKEELFKREKDLKISVIRNEIKDTEKELLRLYFIRENIDNYHPAAIFTKSELSNFSDSNISKEEYLEVYIQKLKIALDENKAELEKLTSK